MRNFFLQFLSSIAQNVKCNLKKILQNYFNLVLFSLIAGKRAIWRISCVSMLSITKQLVCKLDVLQSQTSATVPELTVYGKKPFLSKEWDTLRSYRVSFRLRC